MAIFSYVSRGLFENHKTVFAAHLTFQVNNEPFSDLTLFFQRFFFTIISFQILSLREHIPVEVTEFLLHQNLEESHLESPVDFMNAQAWAAVRVCDKFIFRVICV